MNRLVLLVPDTNNLFLRVTDTNHLFLIRVCDADARPRTESVSMVFHDHAHIVNTLQMPRTMHALERYAISVRMLHAATHCNTLQRTATDTAAYSN